MNTISYKLILSSIEAKGEHEIMCEILGLDLGTYNTKTSTEFICRSVYSENTMFNIRNKNIIEYNEIRYQVGVGKLDTEIVKANRKNQIPLFLYAVGNSVANGEKVKLIMGLPQFQLENDEQVKQIKEMYVGKFDFKMSGENRNFEVLDITIFPEGMGAYYTIDQDLSNKDVILIDIGGSTFNVLLFKNNEFIKAKSLPFGSMNLASDMLARILSEHGGRHNIDDVANYIQRGRVGKTNDTMLYKLDLARPYINELISLLTLEFPKNDADYYISGGGVTMFSEAIIEQLGDDVRLIGDYLFANAMGFKMIGDVLYG